MDPEHGSKDGAPLYDHITPLLGEVHWLPISATRFLDLDYGSKESQWPTISKGPTRSEAGFPADYDL
jgi:hypothetical protein